MNRSDKVAVCSRSFSRHAVLREELLARYEHVTFNDSGRQLEGRELVSFLRGHDKAITALERIDETVLSQLPELKVIGKYGVGLDMIDLAAMRSFGKRLGWSGGVNRRSVSELVIAFAVSMLRNIPLANREVTRGSWKQLPGGLLSGRTVGVIGCGFVGKDLIQLLEPWGCNFLAHDILDFPDFYSKYQVTPVGLEDLLKESDVVTLHVPLDRTTKNIINMDRLAMMKSSAVLINAARGGIVDEGALKAALVGGQIAAAAFDVFETEPPQDVELLTLPNFLATPHIGGSAEEAILAMGRAAMEGLECNEIPQVIHSNDVQMSTGEL